MPIALELWRVKQEPSRMAQAFIDSDICGYGFFRTLLGHIHIPRPPLPWWVLSLAHINLEANELVGIVRVHHKGLGLRMVGKLLVMLSVSSEMRGGRGWCGWRRVCRRRLGVSGREMCAMSLKVYGYV